MILIVNTSSDTSITEELKRNFEEKHIEAEIIEAAPFEIVNISWHIFYKDFNYAATFNVS